VPGLPVLALTQGDPAGIGPEILLKSVARCPFDRARLLLIAERVALAAVQECVPAGTWERLAFVTAAPTRRELADAERVFVLDPVGAPRAITLGRSGAEDARGAMAALDAGIALVRSGAADGLVTAPVAKSSIAEHVLPGFVGHTDYLAAACGLTQYGRDYLMAFLAPELKVALLTVHVPLREAIRTLSADAIVAALACLARHARGRIAVAGLNPHAGEAGLLGSEDRDIVAPAVASARARGIDAHGPESADSLFARARRGEFDWVLALYHDQGLIAVKTASFGLATNWTMGLPFLRTSVDHGTAFHLAGKNLADEGPLLAVIETTLDLLASSERRLAD